MKQNHQTATGNAASGSGSLLPSVAVITNAVTVRAGAFPRKADKFAAVANTVTTGWAAAPDLKLRWITQPQFAALAATFTAAQGSRSSAGGARTATTRILSNLDRKATRAVAFVKGYLLNKWETEADAVAQYARYGIHRANSRYSLPADRQQRLAALSMMVTAISDDGFGSEKYGSAFWTTLQSGYAAALTDAGTQDGAVSTGVSTKRNTRQLLVKAMKALQLLIMANYPDDWNAMFRTWGWQKEDY